jgi:signal transduction histidine kinase
MDNAIDHNSNSHDSELDQLRELVHEIKNPLSTIRMTIENLADDFEKVNTPEARQALKKLELVNRQCSRLDNLLKDFREFAKLKNLRLKAGSLNEQLAQVLDFFEEQAKHQNVEIVRYLDADLPSIMMDAPKLHAALMNLIKNAFEAMPTGGQLVARTRITKSGVALDLIDNGAGMGHKTLMQMFQPFYTTKENGSGLGLPAAQKIIEAHGALINVNSEIGQGTQFSIEFPTPKRI